MLVADEREVLKRYSEPDVVFCPAPTALFQGLAQIPECEVYTVSCVQKPVRTPVQVAENICSHSIVVPKWGWLRGGYLGCIRAARQKLRSLRPDLVHAQGTERDCGMSAVFSGLPNIVTIHGNMAELARVLHARVGSFGWLTARLENLALKRTGGVLCNSAYTEGLVRPRARRAWRVANALRAQFFAPSACSKPLSPCVVLNVGVVTPNKRQVEILEVARALHEQGLRFEVHFIGIADPKSNYAAAFLKRIREAEQRGYGRYLGTKSTAELIHCFDQASALVHFPIAESFGLVVAEALARQLKFFGARVGGIPDIAEGLPGTELFGEQDWPGLGTAIAHWIRAGYPRPAQSAHQIGARFHPNVIAQRHVEIYHELLGVVE